MRNARLGAALVGAMLLALAAVVAGVASAQEDDGQGRGAQTGTDLAGLWEKRGLGLGTEERGGAGGGFVPAELVVGLKEGVARSTEGLERAAVASGGRVKDELADPLNRALLLKFPSDQAAQVARDGLEKRPDVEFVERNGIVEGSSVSSDPGTGYQWHHTVMRKTANLGTLSTTPPTIAVVDSGVDYNHPDLSGKVILGPDYVNNDSDPMDDHGHGTHVAGIAAAKAGNGQFGEGVSPSSKILAVKVLDGNNLGNIFGTAQGLAYARTANTPPDVKVINASLGGIGDSTVISEEVDAIKAAGKVLVASAMNQNTTTPYHPAADPDTALRVMATNESDCRARFSNFSPSSNPNLYNIAAPGTNIHSTFPGGHFVNFEGTSMSTPMVAGAAALVWGKTPSLTRDQLVNRLVGTGEPTSCGFAAPTRRLDVRKALLGTAETAIVGQVLDPATGRAPSPDTTPVTAKLYSGTTLLKSDATDRYGFYEMTGLAAGTGRQLKDTRSGYVSALLRNPITIASGQVAGPSTDALPQSRPTGNATVTIDWKTHQPTSDTPGCVDACNGWEFDLTLRLPGGGYLEPIGGRPQGSLTAAPFALALRDSHVDFSPVEGLVIGSQAANGTYKVVANKWYDPAGANFNPSWNGSQASVQMYNGAASMGGGLKAVPGTCGTNRFWYVGDLTKSGTSYAWTNKNICTNTAP